MGRHKSANTGAKAIFARAIHDGASGSEACAAAGFTGTNNALRNRAYHLRRDTTVIRLLEQLELSDPRPQAPEPIAPPAPPTTMSIDPDSAQFVGITTEDMEATLERIVDVDMADFFTVDGLGGVTLALGKALESGAFTAVRSFTLKPDGSVVFALHDRIRAIKELKELRRSTKPAKPAAVATTPAHAQVPTEAVSLDEARAMRAAKRAAGE